MPKKYQSLADEHRARILHQMKRGDLSQNRVAKQAEIPVSYFNSFLIGRQGKGCAENPSLAWLDRIYRAIEELSAPNA